MGKPAADSVVYRDSETGFTFSQYNAPYTLGRTITYRVALPSTLTYGQPYDVVLQIVAPSDVGWAGLAWGGRMTNNPLSVSWANGYSSVVLSSRYAPSVPLFLLGARAPQVRLTDRTGTRRDHSKVPPTYSGAWYEVLKTGTHVNSTHWQVTAKCSGCTYYTGASGTVRLEPNGSNRLAFAYGAQKPFNPSSNTSGFAVHDSFNSWVHDFQQAQNTGFSSLVTKNSGRR